MRNQGVEGCLTLLLLLLSGSDGSAEATENNGDVKNDTLQLRLTSVTTPISYEIKLVLEMTENNFTFHGESRINVTFNDPTRNVTLHSKDLRIDENFTNLVAWSDESLELKPVEHAYDVGPNLLIIQFDKLIPAGNYTLGIKYSGNMSNLPEGIYNSSYTTESGEKSHSQRKNMYLRSWLVATKFTQLHARQAFPCWDQPDLKATFKLSIKHDANYAAVSNMPIRKKIVDADGKQWTYFDITPRMSTYLLAFVVSDFDCLRDEADKINVCGRKQALPNFKHSRFVSQRAMELLERYTEYKYNLPKMDQYAIPDATTGGTENWGLIIYRESSFAYVPFVNPVSGKEYVTLTVVHELAHQWIGNLITPSGWAYSWIKEGLPTFLQYYIVDKLFADWREMDMFVTRVIQETAFNCDDSDNHKPLEWSPDNAINIKSKFSPQLYNRGAAIFHTMSNILTEPIFKSGVARFIKDNEFGSITSEDLWRAMQSAYDERHKESSEALSVKEIMRGWVEQQGYPIVNVTRDYEGGRVMITQEGNLEQHRSNRWWIPINFATKTDLNFKNTAPSHWLKPGDGSLVIDGIDRDDWIIVNVEQSGYYRVNYDTENWKRIAQWMDSEMYKEIPARTRAQLINDLSYMVSTKRHNYTTFLDLASYLIRERDYQPWLPTFHAMRKLRRMMYDVEVDEELKKFVLGLMKNVIDKIDFQDTSKHDWVNEYRASYENLDNKTKKFVPTEKALEKIYKSEDFLTRRFRAKFLSFACSLGHELCKRSASSQLRDNLNDATKHPVSPDLVSWVYCYGAESNEEGLRENINGSDIKYLGYLSCSPNKTVLRNYVEQVLSGNLNATSKQARIAIAHLGEDDSSNFVQALDYLLENFDTIYKYFDKDRASDKSTSKNVNVAVSILNDYIWRTRTYDAMQKIIDFIAKEPSRIPHWIEESIARQKKKIQWSEENAPILGEWLHDHLLNASD